MVLRVRKRRGYSPDRHFVTILVKITKYFGPMGGWGFWPPCMPLAISVNRDLVWKKNELEFHARHNCYHKYASCKWNCYSKSNEKEQALKDCFLTEDIILVWYFKFSSARNIMSTKTESNDSKEIKVLQFIRHYFLVKDFQHTFLILMCQILNCDNFAYLLVWKW